MGMFDYLRCDYKLPINGANQRMYQTKDTPEQFLDLYVIDENGNLLHEDYEIEDHSDPNAEGLMRFAGCMTRINKHLVNEDFTGEIRFYTPAVPFDKDIEDCGWIEFSAYFVGGLLKHLEFIENIASSPQPSLTQTETDNP
jgi:hypothetical protein